MEKGNREYFKLFVVLALLICAIILVVNSQAIPGVLSLILVPIAFVYIALFFAGIIMNLGPFKYISRQYAEDAQRKKESKRSKQPWE